MSKPIRIWREPLVHFLLLGGLLFAIYAYRGGPELPREDEIVVSQGAIESLLTQWQRTWQRPPTPEEFQGLINEHVREEVFYREAKRMGLAENDTIIRRRLRQKMEFLAEELAESVPLDDAALRPYFEKNAEQYRRDACYTFQQIYFSTEQQERDLPQMIARAVQALNSADAHPEDTGDRTLLPSAMSDATEREIGSTFGVVFVEELAAAEMNRWVGPIESGLGQHIVFIAEKKEGEIPPLEAVRPEVERDWYAEQRRRAKDTLFEELLAQYEVRIESPDWEGEGEGT